MLNAAVLRLTSTAREKQETLLTELPAIGSVAGSVKMVDDVVLKNATETAWTVYRARHPHVGARDSRRCLLERHLHRRWEERDSDTEELASLGIAYLHRLPRFEC